MNHPITLLSLGVLECRLFTVYKNMRHGNYEKASRLLLETLNIMEMCHENDIPSNIDDIARRQLYQAMMYMSLGNYNKAHDHVRDLHYAILELFYDKTKGI